MGSGSTSQWRLRQPEQAGIKSRLVRFQPFGGPDLRGELFLLSCDGEPLIRWCGLNHAQDRDERSSMPSDPRLDELARSLWQLCQLLQ
jgi:hypothetical protein